MPSLESIYHEINSLLVYSITQYTRTSIIITWVKEEKRKRISLSSNNAFTGMNFGAGAEREREKKEKRKGKRGGWMVGGKKQ